MHLVLENAHFNGPQGVLGQNSVSVCMFHSSSGYLNKGLTIQNKTNPPQQEQCKSA